MMLVPEFVFVLMSVACWTGSSLFIGLFLFEPWRRTPFGRSLMAMGVAVWMFSLMASARLFLEPTQPRPPAYPGEDVLRLVVYSLVIYAVWSRSFVLIRERRKDRALA